MTTGYKRHTLGELVEALRALPDGARVNGLHPDISFLPRLLRTKRRQPGVGQRDRRSRPR